jgi:hypothetical protein
MNQIATTDLGSGSAGFVLWMAGLSVALWTISGSIQKVYYRSPVGTGPSMAGGVGLEVTLA